MSLPVFPVVILSSNTEHISRVARKEATEQKVQPCFFTKSVKFRSFEVFPRPIESSPRDLQSEHGLEAFFLKQKLKNMKKDNENVYFGSSLRNDCLLVRMFGSDAKAIKDRAIRLLLEIWQVDTPNVWKV